MFKNSLNYFYIRPVITFLTRYVYGGTYDNRYINTYMGGPTTVDI